ncbi:MAG: UvrB/UvrC motif-containing protein [Planctomycetes bacterium]|nr:UvrB/UvrC motif-containing protein [Planctomycetota bacterium]
MILCQKCKKNIANVHLTEMISGQRNETHLCESCAQAMKLPSKHPVSFEGLIGMLMEKGQKKRRAEGRRMACPDCGITFAEFKNKGRLGCANDYTFFQDELDALLKKVHGSTRYVGKVPPGRESKPIFRNELLRLRDRLKQVVKAEQYEEAAQIRDRIVELEGMLGGANETAGGG